MQNITISTQVHIHDGAFSAYEKGSAAAAMIVSYQVMYWALYLGNAVPFSGRFFKSVLLTVGQVLLLPFLVLFQIRNEPEGTWSKLLGQCPVTGYLFGGLTNSILTVSLVFASMWMDTEVVSAGQHTAVFMIAVLSWFEGEATLVNFLAKHAALFVLTAGIALIASDGFLWPKDPEHVVHGFVALAVVISTHTARSYLAVMKGECKPEMFTLLQAILTGVFNTILAVIDEFAYGPFFVGDIAVLKDNVTNVAVWMLMFAPALYNLVFLLAQETLGGLVCQITICESALVFRATTAIAKGSFRMNEAVGYGMMFAGGVWHIWMQ